MRTFPRSAANLAMRRMIREWWPNRLTFGQMRAHLTLCRVTVRIWD